MNRRGFFRSLIGGIAAAALGDLIPKPVRLMRFGGGKVYGYINLPPRNFKCRCVAVLPMSEWIGKRPVIHEEVEKL